MKRTGRICWIAGALAIAAMAAGLFTDRGMFLRAWILGWYFWFSLSMGCLAILMLQYIIHGEWGFIVRRQLEAGVFTLPAMSVLFVPVLLGVNGLYEWAAEGLKPEEPIYCFKCTWLSVPFFIGRSVFYLAVFVALGRALLARSRNDDEQGAAVREARLNALGAGGLIVYFLVFTLAAVDWIMSLEPEWHSTIFGAQLMMGQAISAVSLAVIATVWLRRRGPLRGIARTAHVNDLGNLMLAFVMLWTYMAFMQYLIVWCGNLREDNVWFIHRGRGGWPILAAALALVHFAVPFAILLSRTAKRNGAIMAGVAGLLLFAHAGDCFWLIVPNFNGGRGSPGWMDLAALVGIGGVWLGFFLYRLAAMPVVPKHDFRFEYVNRRAVEGEA